MNLDKKFFQYLSIYQDTCVSDVELIDRVTSWISESEKSDFIELCDELNKKEINQDKYDDLFIEYCSDLYCILGSIDWGDLVVDTIDNCLNEIKIDIELNEEISFEEFSKGLTKKEIIENYLDSVEIYTWFDELTDKVLIDQTQTGYKLY